MKRTTITRRSYQVALTVKQFQRVIDRDSKASDLGLLSMLEKMGAHSIEYNGHFGAAIYYTLNVEDDNEGRRGVIEQMIVDYANGRKRAD